MQRGARIQSDGIRPGSRCGVDNEPSAYHRSHDHRRHAAGAPYATAWGFHDRRMREALTRAVEQVDRLADVRAFDWMQALPV